LSDHDSRATYSDRPFAPADYEEQRYSISALQDALAHAHEAGARWKAKAQELDGDLTNTRKDMKEVEARWRGLVDRNELIEGEKKKLYSEKKALAEENASLRDQLAALQAQLDKVLEKVGKKSSKKPQGSESSPPPAMSGAIPNDNAAAATTTKIRRSASKSRRDKAGEAEQAQKEKERLSRRFEQRSDESSDANSGASTAKSHRSRRQSYVEPLGPPAARPVVAQVPPSPTRHYTNYTTSSQYPPQYASIREPAVSNLPRSIHPAVSYVYEEPKPHFYAPDHHSQREASRR
jgi:chromosome segregation ATPase